MEVMFAVDDIYCRGGCESRDVSQLFWAHNESLPTINKRVTNLFEFK